VALCPGLISLPRLWRSALG